MFRDGFGNIAINLITNKGICNYFHGNYFFMTLMTTWNWTEIICASPRGQTIAIRQLQLSAITNMCQIWIIILHLCWSLCLHCAYLTKPHTCERDIEQENSPNEQNLEGLNFWMSKLSHTKSMKKQVCSITENQAPRGEILTQLKSVTKFPAASAGSGFHACGYSKLLFEMTGKMTALAHCSYISQWPLFFTGMVPYWEN